MKRMLHSTPTTRAEQCTFLSENEVERLQEWYVPYLQDTIKDNGMAVVNGAAGGVGSLVSCEIYQKINVHKTSIYSYIYRPYWCWKNTSGSRYDRDPTQQAF